jgi:hypothetical protein
MQSAGSSTTAPGPNDLFVGTPGDTPQHPQVLCFASQQVPAVALPGVVGINLCKTLKDSTNMPHIIPSTAGGAAPKKKSRGKGKPHTMSSTVVAGQRLGDNLIKLSDEAA